MRLMLRVETGDAAEGPCDVVLDVEPGHRIAELTAAVAARVGRPGDGLVSLRSGRLLDPSATVELADLVSGDAVRVGSSPVPTPRREPAIAIDLAVVGGPDAGESRLLVPGRYAVGRHPGCDVVLGDATVSRRHAWVTVHDDWRVAVSASNEASGPVRVNGCEIEGSLPVGDDDVVTIGQTRLALRRFECAELRRNDRLGQVEFQRTPYRPPVVAERGPERIGPIPRRPEARRFQLLAVLAPLAAGFVLYAFSRQLQFLALTLVSPLVMIANVVDDRRSGRRAMGDELVDFRDSLVCRRHDLERLRSAERVERWRSAPDLSELLQRAARRSIDLWSRSRGAPDFLQLRLGLGSVSTAFEIAVESGGDDELRAEALATVDGLTQLHEMPITIDLVAAGVFGLHGRGALVDGVVSSLIVQAACLHSPDDLTIVAAIDVGRPFGWLKWLPHVRSVTSPVAGPHVATDTVGAERLVAALLEVARFRQEAGGLGRSSEMQHWPRVLAVIDVGLGADPAELAGLLDLGPAVGLTVVALAGRAADVPHQAASVLALSSGHAGAVAGTLWSTDPGVAGVAVEVERLREPLADRAARALAPVRDASTASLATSIPRSVELLDVIGAAAAGRGGITEQWLMPRSYGLAFPIGTGAAGVIELDLVHDGPHALIGGTSGAGKSELLQSMVVSLASRYSSQRLNFLFVDYKGGAASKVFERLPHTVGYVTNLSTDLALRALTSLRAELTHRMLLMEGRAKDLAEMLQVAPHEAPPSLVIVVDEFATLTKEVPEFVNGIIDVAQRGRSLGIHLVLATQRPSGAVNENILANTNLRISLRMLDRAESTAVIGSPEAADIPVPLRGRAFARLGAHHLVPFQSAYGGAPVVAVASSRPVLVGDFDRPDAIPHRADAGVAPAPPSVGAASVTQLDVVVDAIVATDAALALPAPRRPWCDALPDVVDLRAVVADPHGRAGRTSPGRSIVVGLLDAPERQEQQPLVVDLEDGGGWLVFGTGGAGKTTVLRSVAAALLLDATPAEVAVLAFDFASRGLAGLRCVPHVIDVATGDDLEAVTRHLVMLDRELARRRAALAAANAESLTAYNERHAPIARIVVLIDGFGGMVDALGDGGSILSGPSEPWTERLLRVLVDGRQVGIHPVIATDRRSAVPTRLHAAISNRLVLRHADESAYAEHGIGPSISRSIELRPGRGLVNGATLVQIAIAGSDHSARGQLDAIEELAHGCDGSRTTAITSAPLPERLPFTTVALESQLGVLEPCEVPIGIIDVSGEPAVLDLRWSNVLVVGAPRSGRSTALTTVAAGLCPRYDVHAVGPASSGLVAAGLPQAAFGRTDLVVPVLDRLANLLSMGPTRRPLALLVDDLDALDDPMLATYWERLLGHDALRIVASVETRTLTGFTANPLLVHLKRARRQLLLQPDDAAEFMQLTGVKLPHRPGVRWLPGRGVLLADRVPQLVQVAQVGPGTAAGQEGGRDQRQISVPA